MWYINNTPLSELTNKQKKAFYLRRALSGDKSAKLMYLYYRKIS